MDEDIVYTSKMGGLFVFPQGHTHPGEYVGCTDGADISEPKGDIELMRCFDVWGKWKTVGHKRATPGPVTTTLTSLTFSTRTWLERLRGKFGLIYLQRDGGRADTFTNWTRALILDDVRVTTKTFTGTVKRETEDDSTRAFALTARPPVIECVPVTAGAVITGIAQSFEDVAMLRTKQYGIYPVQYGVASCFPPAGITAHVYYTRDGGRSWTDTAAQPGFTVTRAAMAATIIDMGNGVVRLLVAEESGVGTQGRVAYSDDWGATWHLVNIGGAAAGHGPTMPTTLFALDSQHVWIATNHGFIYFSSDAGETWTVQEAGVLVAGTYVSLKFLSDGMTGYAVSSAGALVKTVDGGENWAFAPDDPAAHGASYANAMTLQPGGNVWIAADNGLYVSEDGGNTWSTRIYANHTISTELYSMAFANDWVGFGFAIDSSFGHIELIRTIDGGNSWQAIPIDDPAALGTAIFAGDENYAIAVGWTTLATGYLALIQE